MSWTGEGDPTPRIGQRYTWFINLFVDGKLVLHPNDENGDVLRRLEAKGDDLSRARNIDFSVVFPNEQAAENFARHFRNMSYRVTVELARVRENHPWDAVVVNHMVPSHSAITEFERELEEVADALVGYNDGWGCFSQ